MVSGLSRTLRNAALSALLLTGAAGAQAPDPQAALETLRDYIRIPNVNPPADSTASVAFLKHLLEKEGIAVELYGPSPEKTTLIARLPGRRSGEALLLLHHMDVVPADASRWPADPFGAEIKDGYLYGRGAVDMKSIGVMQLTSFIALKRAGVPLERPLILMASPDEESGGSEGAQWMVEHHWDRLKPKYVFDEGGFGTPDLLSRDGRLTFGVSVAEKKILWTRLHATGTAGHGSQPIPDNANDRLLRVLQKLKTRPGAASPVVDELRRRVGPLADNKFTRAITSDTVSLTSLRSGVGDPPKVNVIPSRADASLDCRLLPETDGDRYLSELRQAVDSEPGVELEIEYRMDEVPISPHGTELFQIVERELRASYPGSIVTPYLVPFGTDSNTLRRAGALAYGFSPMVLDASMVASMHSDAERLPVAAWAPALRCYYQVVRAYCTASSPGE